MLLRDAKRRDKLIKTANDTMAGEELSARIKELEAEYGPWQRKGLEQQLAQFSESTLRFEEAVEREQRSIDEMVELLGQCRARDKELTRLGA